MAAVLGAILGDVTDTSSAIIHNIYLVDHMTDYLFEVKYFPNIVTPQKPRGGVTSHPNLLLPPLYHGGGISLRVRLRVNII